MLIQQSYTNTRKRWIPDQVRDDASGDTHKTIQHPLPSRMFEVDLELVAFDCGDSAVAELAVKQLDAPRQIL